jgi:hypothetical protein
MERLRKITKTSVRMASAPAKIQAKHLLNTFSVTARPAYWATKFVTAVLHAKCSYVSVTVSQLKTE